MPEALTLIEPTLALTAAYRELIDESLALCEDSYPRLFAFLGLPLHDTAQAIAALGDLARPSARPTGVVPSTTWWLVRDGERILAECRLRHRLNAMLEHEGGHIGYLVRPSERRLGYGTRLLGLALERARDFGLTRVLLTCDANNVGSARIIEHNGGVLENQVLSRHSGALVSRYWIDLQDSGEAGRSGR